MIITIEQVSDIKNDDRGTSAKIKCGADSYYVNQDPTQYQGKQVEVEVTEKTSAKGNKYKIAKILKVVEGVAGGAGNGQGVSWRDYEKMAGLAHALAKGLEPDEVDMEATGERDGETVVTPLVKIDRSHARAAILNTVMINFANGKIRLDDDGDQIPF